MPFVPPDNSASPDPAASAPKSRDRRSRKPHLNAVPGEDLRNFTLEVSARRSTSPATGQAQDDVQQPTYRQPAAVESENDHGDSGELPTASHSDTDEANAAASAESLGLSDDADDPCPDSASALADATETKASEVDRPNVTPRRPRQPKEAGKRPRALPAWATSLVVHSAMLAVLATVSLATVVPPPQLEMVFSPPVAEEVVFEESPNELTGDVGAIVADEAPVELIDPGTAALGGFIGGAEDLGTGFDIAGDTGPVGTPGGGPLGEIGSLLGEEGGTGTGAFGSGLGGAPTAKFFGAEIAGRRIVFVLDNSGSMQGGRLETVIAELLNCLDRLRDDQEFYILFHSDAVYPMLYPDPIDRYLRPTKANKRMVAAWLDTVELCLGDSVEDAIAAAAMIEPDTVFLLSDGRIQGENKFRVLLSAESRDFPIHTFAVGMNGSVAGRKNLQLIADANGGDFTESSVPPEMRDLSRTNLRPYHNETPGPVWGRHVKPFKFGK